MIPRLETPRLLLRKLEPADAVEVQKLFPHWEIVKYLAKRVPWPYPDDGGFDVLPGRCASGHGARRRLALVTEINTRSGATHRRGVTDEGRERQSRFLDGIALARTRSDERSGRGGTDYWFDVLGFPVLRAPKAVVNTASRRISKKTESE